MGYPLQPNAPQCVAPDGRTIAIGAFVFPNPIGSWFKTGVYARDPVEGWIEIAQVSIYANPGDCLADVKAHGTIAAYMTWFVGQINMKLAQIYQPAPPAPTEPTTDAEAMAAITARTDALTLTVINGIPVLH